MGIIIIYIKCCFEYDVYYPIDGQKVTKKLAQQISKETNAIKILLQEYNACSNEYCNEITLSEAMDPSVIATKLEKVGLATPTAVSSGK